MTRPSINTTLRTSGALRVRVQALESEVLRARAEAEAAREAEQLARKAASDAWSILRQLRGAPMRGETPLASGVFDTRRNYYSQVIVSGRWLVRSRAK